MSVRQSSFQYLCQALILGCLLSNGSLSWGTTPYQQIAARNLFGLRPPPIKPVKPLVSSPKITLTGITTILKGKRALLKVQLPAKPFQPAMEQAYILAEGQREGQIQVLEINEKAAEVTLDSYGTITNITFEKVAPSPSSPRPPRRRVVENPGIIWGALRSGARVN